MQDENTGVDPTIGTPETDTSTWDGQQSYDDTCTIRSQEFIIEQFTGQEVDEATLVEEAEANGFYTPGSGTSFEHTGSLLELYGIPVDQYWDATTHDLANQLAQGHKVILSVDAGELWGEENPVLEEVAGISDRDVDHDVVVSGIDTTDPENPQVIVSDPGTGEAAAHYPLDQFLAAWQDSSFFMMATEEPVPPTAPEMANFPYEVGHIPEVAGVPYEEFTQMDPESWNATLEQLPPASGPDGNPETDDYGWPGDETSGNVPGGVGYVSTYDANAPINEGDGVYTEEEEAAGVAEQYDDDYFTSSG